jgi:hypothetical protein
LDVLQISVEVELVGLMDLVAGGNVVLLRVLVVEGLGVVMLSTEPLL